MSCWVATTNSARLLRLLTTTTTTTTALTWLTRCARNSSSISSLPPTAPSPTWCSSAENDWGHPQAVHRICMANPRHALCPCAAGSHHLWSDSRRHKSSSVPLAVWMLPTWRQLHCRPPHWALTGSRVVVTVRQVYPQCARWVPQTVHQTALPLRCLVYWSDAERCDPNRCIRWRSARRGQRY